MMSRVKIFRLDTEGLEEAFACRAKQIAEAEGLDGRPLPEYLKLAERCRGNFRAILQKIDAGDMIP